MPTPNPLTSIGAAIFTDLSVVTGVVTAGVASAPPVPVIATSALNAAGFQALFGTVASIATYAKIKNVREFPAVGTPANIVNVPIYGQKIGQSIGGQADAPTLELTINYVPSDWTAGVLTTPEGALATMVGDGITRAWRFTLMNADYSVTSGATLSKYDSSAAGLGTVGNAQYYFLGRMESLLVTPSLTDATTAKISISLQSQFYGAYAS